MRHGDEVVGIKPFHEWKAERYKQDQENRTPHTTQWYYGEYGRYCNKMRREYKERLHAQT